VKPATCDPNASRVSAPWILPSTLDSVIRAIQSHASRVSPLLPFVFIYDVTTLQDGRKQILPLANHELCHPVDDVTQH
jgi:hypothetical protein